MWRAVGSLCFIPLENSTQRERALLMDKLWTNFLVRLAA